MRGTTRDPGAVAEIESAGAEAVVGDPDRIATLSGALDHVGLACILLGSAAGPSERVAALHGTRLEMLLSQMIDSTVRAVLYEARGSVDGDVLESGASRVRSFCEDSRIPYALLDADPGEPRAWLDAAVVAVMGLLSPR